MTIKKLSMAAAISFGLLAMGTTVTYAQEDVNVNDSNITEVAALNESQDSNLQNCDYAVTGPACPLEAPCPEPCPAVPCPEPCPVQPACPVEAPCDPCAVMPACPCDPCAQSPCASSLCTDDTGPACATCQGVPDKPDFCERMIYAYPSGIFGPPSGYAADPYAMTTGNFCPSNNCSLGMCDGNQLTTARNAYDMLTGAAAGVGCGLSASPCCAPASTCSTGAAAAIPCPCDPCGAACPRAGSSVDRSVEAQDSFGCPVTIHSNSSLEVMKKSMLPVEIKTGAAVPLTHPFCDVPADFWAAADIDRLTSSKVIAGYPDQTFRPNCPVTRAEFASLVVSGLNYQGEKHYGQAIFCDVPECNWANIHIDKGVNAGLIAGYPDGTYKPDCNVTRAEALVIMSKALMDCELDECNATAVLAQYCDNAEVPDWAKLSLAKVLKAGILDATPTPNQIKPNLYATRAEIASMLASMRIAMGIDPEPVACGCVETGAAAFVEQQEVIKIPTLKVKMDDSISARNNEVGDKFVAYTTECITVNGITYPADSKVHGQIVEVVRPTRNNYGSLKLAFTEIENGTQANKLPKEILCAEVEEVHTPNWFSRLAEWPFTWTGRLIGNVGRTAGGIVVIAGNGIEEAINSIGIAAGELFQGKFLASGRSIVDSVAAVIRTPVDIARTAISGTAGIFNITADEIAFVVDPEGNKIAEINPNEVVKVAFGCQ